ncbi:MAG TPA: hypothetical protein VH720_03795 [Candidatus Limnocylindrales bacterium]
MSAVRRSWFLVCLGLVTVACGASGQPSASVAPSTPSSAAASEGGVSGLPPGCEPINLRDPTGERLELDGQWAEVGTPDRGELMTWWLFTQGTCVWGAGQVGEVRIGTISSSPDQVQSLSGQIGSDFVITGELVWLGPVPPGAPGVPIRYAPLRMLIEFDDAGQVLLRDTREAGVRGPHCPEPTGFCPDPLVLERVE